MSTYSKSVSFFAANDFLEIFSAFRVVKISGRYGGGKTALGVMLGAWLQASGKVDRFVSNVPNVFSSPIVTPLFNSAIMLDESWQYLETREDVLAYAAFLRKFNHYLILPTVFPIHSRLNFFSVQRVFNAYAVGVPAWVYRWELSSGKVREKGYFSVFNPRAVFGLFDSEFVPGDDAGISDALINTAVSRGFKKRSKGGTYYDPSTGVPQAPYPSGSGGPSLPAAQIAQMAEVIAEIEDAAAGIFDAEAELSALSKKLGRSVNR